MNYTEMIVSSILAPLVVGFLLFCVNWIRAINLSLRDGSDTKRKVEELMSEQDVLNKSISSANGRFCEQKRETESMIHKATQEIHEDIDDRIERALEPIRRELNDARKEMRESFSNVSTNQMKIMEILVKLKVGGNHDL